MEWDSLIGLDEYEKLVIRMNTPRVVIDNAVCSASTIVKVDSGSKHRILLETVQVLTDLNLSIKKAYISSDGRWFMDVFHVTDLNGNKLTDESVISYIQQSLGDVQFKSSKTFDGLTALELTGTDRVGLLSEVSAVLADLECNVVEAKLWTHNGRIASLIYVSDINSGSSINDSMKITGIEARLRQIVKGDIEIRSARTCVSTPVLHIDRRLHQMMFTDRDYEHEPLSKKTTDSPIVSVQNWTERSYSVINIQCKDRTKLLFDVVCTLTDMEYVVFHATMKTSDERAYMEFYLRHSDGTLINSESEMDRVRLCIQAAIERRVSEGMRLELCAEDRYGLLADVTRIFRENGLNLTKAEISTIENAALNIFHVTDALGAPPDARLIESIRQTIGSECLRVKEHHHKKDQRENQSVGVRGPFLVLLGSLVKKNLYNLGLIKSYS